MKDGARKWGARSLTRCDAEELGSRGRKEERQEKVLWVGERESGEEVETRRRFQRAQPAGRGGPGQAKGAERERAFVQLQARIGGAILRHFPFPSTGGHWKVTAKVTDSPFSPAFPDPLPHTLAHTPSPGCPHPTVNRLAHNLPPPFPPNFSDAHSPHGSVSVKSVESDGLGWREGLQRRARARGGGEWYMAGRGG